MYIRKPDRGRPRTVGTHPSVSSQENPVLTRSLHPNQRSLMIALSVVAMFATTASLTGAQSSSDPTRNAGWRSDIAYYLDQVRHRHYVYRSRPLPPAMLTAADQLSANVPRYSDERMLAEFEHLASFAGD